MKFILSVGILLLCVPALMAAPGAYDQWFTPSTMRIDYFDTGTKGQEIISLDKIYEEGEWPGSNVNLVDTLNLGEYSAQIFDQQTNVLIYSRGYSSMFNEWQTTDEALAGVYRTIPASIRIPYPKRSFRLVIARRDKRLVLREIYSGVIDPNAPVEVVHNKKAPLYPVKELVHNGPPSEKVDILILGDGYARSDMEKFRADAKHFNSVMFSTPPFSERKNDFNVWTIEVESPSSGVDVPDKGVWKGSRLGCMYNTFGSARYILTAANRELRDIAAAAPYDFICILVNDSRYGGGGIYNLYATTYTNEQVKGQQWQMDYVYVHEFGHSFAGLGDEYYSSSTAYNDFYSPGIEPWEPNITALLDRSSVKWSTLVTAGTPIPTPWEKAKYDSIETQRGKLDRLAKDYYEKREPLYRAEMEILKANGNPPVVGAFEGAGYAAHGLYRPSLDCRMFSLSLVGFDPVCSAAIKRMIDFYSR